jgi:hypothetical protein
MDDQISKFGGIPRYSQIIVQSAIHLSTGRTAKLQNSTRSSLTTFNNFIQPEDAEKQVEAQEIQVLQLLEQKYARLFGKSDEQLT